MVSSSAFLFSEFRRWTSSLLTSTNLSQTSLIPDSLKMIFFTSLSVVRWFCNPFSLFIALVQSFAILLQQVSKFS
ncbi:hypothetical protein ES703_125837 [subsurface metagenome]